MNDDQLDDYDRNCLDLIAEHGWMIQGVFPTPTDPGVPFAYTVGLADKGRPELVISGLPAETAQALLNLAAKRHLEDELTAGDTLDGITQGPLMFRVVDASEAEVNMSRHLYGHDRVRALQLVWPDKDGSYPGEPGWSLPDDTQPIYG